MKLLATIALFALAAQAVPVDETPELRDFIDHVAQVEARAVIKPICGIMQYRCCDGRHCPPPPFKPCPPKSWCDLLPPLPSGK
ncbi:hypothetical protein Q8F55_007314 [Vanrija albida]|uniref:Uncharacterized protein n=1 Tax=Vanrija albida TaxID=181172 RepID=A0ABR3PZS2_9TREE